MKHFYILIIGLICTVNAGISQTNLYFNNNPCWQIKGMCQVGQNCFQVDYYNYFINGDSLIGSYQYKKVYMKGSGNLQYFAMGPPPSGNPCLSPPPPTYTAISIAFFIRSTGKKIYVHMPGPSSPDTLLYDFNLNVGSSLPTTFNKWSSYSFTVTAMDSINTFNGWMKRFKLNNDPNFDFIEGMGYQNGLIELMPPNVMSCGWTLQCYSQNNTAYYPSSGPSCLLPTKINELIIINKPVIYPNPSEGKYQVRLQDFSANSKIEIYNLTGQLIRSIVPQSETIEIDIQKERSGVYFLKYISNGETRSVKLIKE